MPNCRTRSTVNNPKDIAVRKYPPAGKETVAPLQCRHANMTSFFNFAFQVEKKNKALHPTLSNDLESPHKISICIS
jgi:hypothetical protein